MPLQWFPIASVDALATIRSEDSEIPEASLCTVYRAHVSFASFLASDPHTSPNDYQKWECLPDGMTGPQLKTYYRPRFTVADYVSGHEVPSLDGIEPVPVFFATADLTSAVFYYDRYVKEGKSPSLIQLCVPISSIRASTRDLLDPILAVLNRGDPSRLTGAVKTAEALWGPGGGQVMTTYFNSLERQRGGWWAPGPGAYQGAHFAIGNDPSVAEFHIGNTQGVVGRYGTMQATALSVFETQPGLVRILTGAEISAIPRFGDDQLLSD